MWHYLLVYYVCRGTVQSEGSGTGCWEALLGKPGGPEPPPEGWESSGSGVLGHPPRALAGGHRETTGEECGVRLVLSSSLGFVLILVAVKPGDTHPRRGCQAALAQVRLRWEPDRRLALHGSQEIAAIDSNREAAAASVFTATNRACSAVSKQERHPARLGSCWQLLSLFELMG